MSIPSLLVGQYSASLDMLKRTIDLCPGELWIETPPRYPFWRIAYHAAFFTHLYAATTLEGVVKWKYHDDHMEDLDGPANGKSYAKSDVVEYSDFTLGQLTQSIPDQNLDGPSGIPWWGDFNKMEMHIYNIRHTQHHVGQLVDRLRDGADLEVAWVGKS